MNYLKKLASFKTLDDAQKRNLRDQANVLFVAAIWIGLFVLMFAYAAKHPPKDGMSMPLQVEPHVPAGTAKFF